MDKNDLDYKATNMIFGETIFGIIKLGIEKILAKKHHVRILFKNAQLSTNLNLIIINHNIYASVYTRIWLISRESLFSKSQTMI